MKTLPQPFTEGIHWRKLTPEERGGSPWKYVLLRDVKLRFYGQVCFGNYYLHDGSSRHWGSLTPNFIMVCAGYAWNGSSFSPDLDGVMLSSVVHDLLYQFSGVAGFPFSRSFCDDVFYAAATTRLALAYRLGLLVGGWACWGRKEDGLYIIS